jgi:adenosylcobinamide-phosphate synthase
MDIFTQIVVVLTLDFLFGEPVWLWSRFPHPVRLFGVGISYGDCWLNKGTCKRAKGLFWVLGLVGLTGAIGWIISIAPDFGALEVLGAAILVGHRSLVQHVDAVAKALAVGLAEGRGAVSMIVGRDTQNIDESAVARGAIESAAENFSDGVVAPIFWFALFGLPGIMIYKLVNIADSMIGHRSDKYLQFGWAAARLDDVMNYIPARITALLIILATGSAQALKAVRQDASQHRSPNAGWPEAAMAGALNVALSGPRVYAGELTQDPWVNPDGEKKLGGLHIDRSVHILWRCWWVLILLAAVVAAVRFSSGLFF